MQHEFLGEVLLSMKSSGKQLFCSQKMLAFFFKRTLNVMWLLILFRIYYPHFCTICTTLDLHQTARDVSAFPTLCARSLSAEG
jgi:hypothetical protein